MHTNSYKRTDTEERYRDIKCGRIEVEEAQKGARGRKRIEMIFERQKLIRPLAVVSAVSYSCYVDLFVQFYWSLFLVLVLTMGHKRFP